MIKPITIFPRSIILFFEIITITNQLKNFITLNKIWLKVDYLDSIIWVSSKRWFHVLNSFPNSFLSVFMVYLDDNVFFRKISKCWSMAVPIVINPCFVLILNKNIACSVYPSCIITLNPSVVECYYLFTIVGKISNRWLQFINSFPNLIF